MKIALLGTRGIPARYSGFETFYENLAVRLVERGHNVTVYNRRHFMGDVGVEYHGVRIVTLPGLATKHLDTLSHTAIATAHALTQGYDIIYFAILGNSPLCWIPRLLGISTLLNVDGEDWAREKWGGFARWYQKACERIATVAPTVVISDALGIQRRYKEVYGKETIFVPYGANVQRDEGVKVLERWGLEPRSYFLCVGRLVPENAFHLALEAFRNVRTDKKLVIVGDAPYSSDYKKDLTALAAQDPRVVMTGYAFAEDYAQLSSHAYAFVLPSGVDGTRPVLLDQMGFGNCVLVRNSMVNAEVISGFGAMFDQADPVASLTTALQELEGKPEAVEAYRRRVAERIETYYNWEWITDFYEDLFTQLIRGGPAASYDEFIRRDQPSTQPS